MFTKGNILKHIKILLFLVIFHFILITFIKYQLGADMHIGILNNNLVNLWKDFYILYIFILIIVYGYKNEKLKRLNNIYIYIFVITLILGFYTSLVNFQGFKQIVLGFKYDLWFLLPIMIFQILDLDRKDIKNLYKTIIEIIKITISISILFALIRFTCPEILNLIGYGAIGDWKLSAHPPMLYQTGFDGVQRISGIFSGPNHLAFYFTLFGPIILLSILNKKLHYIWGILYIILLFGSLSRSGILAFGLEIILLFIFIFIYYKAYRKYIIILSSIGFLGIGSIGTYLFVSEKYKQIILRGTSTKGHIIRAKQAIQGIKENPILGHGLGTAGPASYYSKTEIVPESWFLQIFYEIGILGGFVWFYFIFYIIYKLYRKSEINYPTLKDINILNIGISIGLIGLLFQGLVLHSFEDAMIVIPGFILIGLLLTYNKTYDHKN